MTPRIYIVEDHEIMRRTLHDFLTFTQDFEVAGAAATPGEALEALSTLAVDLVLVDMSLPGMSGTEFVTAARQQKPDRYYLMLSGHGEAVYVEEALAAGAHGYVLKGDPDEVPKAIRHILGGEVYLSAALRGRSRW